MYKESKEKRPILFLFLMMESAFNVEVRFFFFLKPNTSGLSVFKEVSAQDNNEWRMEKPICFERVNHVVFRTFPGRGNCNFRERRDLCAAHPMLYFVGGGQLRFFFSACALPCWRREFTLFQTHRLTVWRPETVLMFGNFGERWKSLHGCISLMAF